MNSLQFNLEDSPLMSIESPGIIDVSSDSGEEFLVQPGDLPVLQERFRVGGPRTDAMTAFMGAASATLFPPQSVEDSLHETIDTAGTNIERQLMEVIDEHNFGRELSSTSFIDTEFEDSPMSPPESERPTRVQMNSYGRPTAPILPTPRTDNQQLTNVNRPIPTYPPNFANNSTNFQIWHPDGPSQQDMHHNQNRMRNDLPTYDNAPLMIQIPPHQGNPITMQQNIGTNPVAFPNFPLQVSHSTNLLLLPSNERQMYRLIPTVMPHVAGFCDWCGKSYDLIALETLGRYLVATAYDAETVRDRGVRSRAFIDGFEAALFSFKGAGLSQPQGCSGPVVQA